MKKLILALLCTMSIFNVIAATQMRNWTVLPNKVQMIWGTAPSVSSIPGASSSQYAVANGIYDEYNNLLFYVRNGEVLNATSGSVGSIVFDPLKEVVIAPVPGQCRKYYVIMARATPLSSIELYYAIVDASGSVSMGSPVHFATLFGNACGMAASKVISGSGSSAIRYLYCISNSNFSRFTISSSGIASQTNLTPSGLSSLSSSEFLPSEAELNHGGTRFAWGSTNGASGKVYEITTSSPTLITHTLTFQSPCTTSNHSISGLEYDANGNLWVSATSSCQNNKGLYKIVTSTSTASYLGSTTQNFGFTQLELSNHDIILGVSNSGGVGHIIPSNNTFNATTTGISFTVVSNANTNTLPGVYSLPDQIDGENYFYFNGIQHGIADFKINNQTPATGCGSIQVVYNCAPLTFSNLSTGATSYVLEVNSLDVNCALNGVYNYNSGTITTLPTDLRSMPGTGGTYLASNTGRFRVTLTASNGCTTTVKVGFIQVNGSPTAVTSCFTFVNNTTCSGSGVSASANCSSVTNVCTNNPKIKADCSGGQFVGGSFDLVIDEFNSSCGFIQNIGNSLNNPLTSTSDLVCLSLNDFTNTVGLGYFFSNPTGRKYRIRLTIQNLCSSNTKEAWFTDNVSGCKTSWDDEEYTSVVDMDEDVEQVSLFPNPSSGNATLQFSVINSSEKVTAQLYDLQGSVIAVLAEDRMFSNGTHRIEIPSYNIAQGLYFYNIVIGNKSFKGKFVKSN